MQTSDSIAVIQRLTRDLRSRGQTIALVPTMGALHEGHLSLIRLAASRSDIVVVSIFVNPTQFGPSEDFSKYPRDLGGDLSRCSDAGATMVFIPSVEEIYPRGYSTYVSEEHVSKPMEGLSRPTHFRGVTTVVAKLFNKMVNDLHIPVEIVIGETVREADGLAMSSRNRYLSATQRVDATTIYRALCKARDMVNSGELRSDRLIAEATHLLAQQRRIRMIYVAVADRDTMESVREVVPGRAVIAIAVWVDEVRLIDNLVL